MTTATPTKGTTESPRPGPRFFRSGAVEKLYGLQWMKKYLVLEGARLCVHKKPPAKRDAKPEHALALPHVAGLAVGIRRNGGSSYFHLTMLDGTAHLFRCDSVASLGPWVELLARALEHVTAPAAPAAAAAAAALTATKPTTEAPRPPETAAAAETTETAAAEPSAAT